MRAGLRIILAAAAILAATAPAAAQGRDAFVRAFVEFITALDGATGDEGPRVIAALDAMQDALDGWDAAVRGYEARLAAEVGLATPAEAAKMRAAMAVIYLDRGRSADAFRELAAAARLAPGDASLERLRALSRDGRAIALLDDSAAPEPAFPLAHYLRGHQLLAAGRYVEAIAAWRDATRTDPLVSPAAVGGAAAAERTHVRQVDALLAARRLADAERALRAAVAELPQSGQLQWTLGRLYLQVNREPEALRALEAAAALDPIAGAAPLFAAIGRLHYGQFNLAAATTAYERRVALRPGEAAGRRDLAELYVAQDRPDDALAEYRRALEIDDADARAQVGVAQIHLAAGRAGEALPHARRAVTLDGALPEARYVLSRALTALGETEEGRRELDVFQRLQRDALEAERRRFEENLRKIEQTLGATEVAPR